MLVGNFELNHSRRPIRPAWPKLSLTPKRDHVKTQTICIFRSPLWAPSIFLYFFACNPKRDLHV